MKAYAFRIARLAPCAVMSLAAAVLSAAATAQEVSEHDYFGGLPVVLSVSRLAQPLNEVPGAVTIIDRELIRRSGARDVAEVLRLVPGFLLTYRNGATPQAVYHSGMDSYGARMQVYVDGRSTYSSFLLGDTKTGLRGLILEEIERIEVLRGSNSASYGANAFLGVVNIVTRNAADTHGGSVHVTGGDRGINDNFVRYGWGGDGRHFRISAARRSDSGFENRYDDRRESAFRMRADLTPSPRDEITLQFGSTRISSGEGEGLPGNSFRTTEQGGYHLQGSWRQYLAADETLDLRASHEREYNKDTALVRGTLIGSAVSAWNSGDGAVARTEFGIQHALSLTPALRLAYGAEWRHELLQAPGLYTGAGNISLHVWRGFGTVEWRLHPQWLLQASGMQEGHSYTGQTFSPRLAINLHATPDHTLRAGISKSLRAPNFYELRADTRWYNLTPGVLLGGFVPVPVGTQVPVLGWPYLSSGTVKPESIITHEIGYLGHVRPWRLRVDGRAFVERMNDRIEAQARIVPNLNLPFVGLPFPLNSYSALDFVNRPGPHLHGFEYQFDWRPLQDTRLMLAEMHIRSKFGSVPGDALEAPFRTTALTWLQHLPGGLQFSAIATSTTPFKWTGGGDLINTPRRLDVRLGKALVAGTTRGELSIVVQAINGGHQVHKLTQRFNRRAFATLRLDF